MTTPVAATASISATSTAASSKLCALCDVYAQNEFDGKWRELVKVYDQRRNDDNMKEILDMTAPTSRMNDLNGWLLERMAVGELDDATNKKTSRRSGSSRDKKEVSGVKKDFRQLKSLLQKVLASGKSYEQKRNDVVQAMMKQRDSLIVELDAAKEFVAQVHSAQTLDATMVELSSPVPVEKRLLSTVKAPETLPSVDLSDVPSI